MSKIYNSNCEHDIYPNYSECYYEQNIYYPELNIFDENYDIIYEELTTIYDKHPEVWHGWLENELNIFPFYFFGKWCSMAKKLCPRTCEIIKKIPTDLLKTAAFSCLQPLSQIQPHKGWGDLANNILRCHYGISVPDNCGCVCDNFVKLHENRKWLVFDDSKTHSSYNFSKNNEKRIIIIIDMKRPSSIPLGTCTVAYSDNLLEFIKSFYDDDDINDIRTDLQI